MKNAIIVSLIALTLASCASANAKLTVTSKPADLPDFKISAARKPTIQDINFRVVNAGNVEAFIRDAVKSGQTVYILDGANMKKLSGNISELRRYAAQQESIVAGYEKEINRRNVKTSAK